MVLCIKSEKCLAEKNDSLQSLMYELLCKAK